MERNYFGADTYNDGRWKLNPLEQRVADEIGLKWRTTRLWGLPVDEASVREAIAFAYMRADLPIPAIIERADGPFSGVAIAGKLGCTFAWSGFVPESLKGWSLTSLPHNTRNVSAEGFMSGLARSFGRLETRGTSAIDALHAEARKNGPVWGPFDGRAFTDCFRDAAFADFLWRSNLFSDAAAWESLERLFFACGPFFWASADAFVWCAPPASIVRDGAGQLHCETGPAVVYDDGAAAWFWHGRTIESELLVRRSQLTTGAIRNEKNAERRRIMMDLYGLERFVRDAGAKKVGKDRYGTLWSQPEGMLVEVRNATAEPDGSFRSYYLRVPPWVTTPHEAVAWTFDLTPEEYAPMDET